jgi:hypothetical protein
MKRLIAICEIAAVILIVTNPARAIIRNVPTAYPTIQAAVDAAVNGDEVVLADGTYTGDGNRDIDFLGKAITVRSENGPENCVINCQGSSLSMHRGFKFDSGEGPDSIVDGLTITNGYAPDASWQIPSSGVTVTYSAGGAIFCGSSKPSITNCIIESNHADKYGGGIFCVHCTGQTISECVFTGNTSSDTSGGMEIQYSAMTVQGCTFVNNSAPYGGGFSCNDCDSIISNCIVQGNSGGQQGGGANFQNSRDIIVNCTFSDNSAYGYWGGGAIIVMTNSSITLTNSILWGNTAEKGPQISLVGGSIQLLSYCNVQGGEAGISYTCGCEYNWGDGNIDVNPMFVDAVSGDYHLLVFSPCIDAGDNSAPGLPDTDKDGNPRIIGLAVDMGAYEFQEPLPEFDLSGWVFIPPDAPDFGYSVNDADLVYFYSSTPVIYLNFTTGLWSEEGPVGWIYVDWPFYYELDPGTLWFALPPESGIGVYHFSTGQWEVLPRIIP